MNQNHYDKAEYIVGIVEKFKGDHDIIGRIYVVGGARLWIDGLRESYRDIDLWLADCPIKIRKMVEGKEIDGDPGTTLSPRVLNFCF